MKPAELLVARRERLGLSRSRLAKAAGITVQGLHYIEKGERAPRPETAAKLAAVLGLTPDELLREPAPLFPKEECVALLVALAAGKRVGLVGPGRMATLAAKLGFDDDAMAAADRAAAKHLAGKMR